MKKEDKFQIIEDLTVALQNCNSIYLTDTSDLDVETINNLRRLCFRRNVTLKVVKNTLLTKAMEKSGKDFQPLFGVLKGSTSVMFSEQSNEPAKLIKEFRKTNPKPILKGAYIEESCYTGDKQLDVLVNLKSKNELIGDVIGLLQSPARNVIGALQSGGNKLAGILKTLSEKES